MHEQDYRNAMDRREFMKRSAAAVGGTMVTARAGAAAGPEPAAEVPAAEPVTVETEHPAKDPATTIDG